MLSGAEQQLGKSRADRHQVCLLTSVLSGTAAWFTPRGWRSAYYPPPGTRWSQRPQTEMWTWGVELSACDARLKGGSRLEYFLKTKQLFFFFNVEKLLEILVTLCPVCVCVL